LRPIAGNSNEWGKRIESGEILKVGDRVLIVTADHQSHRLTITHLDAGWITGRRQSVPVDQVVSIQKRQFSRAKTIVLVIGVATVCAVGGLLAYTAAHLSLGAF
jgi:hypothetical protein